MEIPFFGTTDRISPAVVETQAELHERLGAHFVENGGKGGDGGWRCIVAGAGGFICKSATTDTGAVAETGTPC
jgi:hypothetical protein